MPSSACKGHEIASRRNPSTEEAQCSCRACYGQFFVILATDAYRKYWSLMYTERTSVGCIQGEAVGPVYREKVIRHVYREKQSYPYTGREALPALYRESFLTTAVYREKVIPPVYREKRCRTYTGRTDPTCIQRERAISAVYRENIRSRKRPKHQSLT